MDKIKIRLKNNHNSIVFLIINKEDDSYFFRDMNDMPILRYPVDKDTVKKLFEMEDGTEIIL